MVNMFECFDDNFFKEVEEVISKWNLSKNNKVEFLKLREYYNDNLDMDQQSIEFWNSL